ncbi:hypothetical protein EP342_01615 [bacterium]|nr:MAG: hypothetical protein EP342_01615 [bacterium]
MIKSIGNSESINLNFDSILSKLSDRNIPIENNKNDRLDKQANDEFKKTFDPSVLENEISKLLDDSTLVAQFSTDKDTDKLILKIINQDTDEVVRQYPPEASLKIARIVDKLIKDNSLADARI